MRVSSTAGHTSHGDVVPFGPAGTAAVRTGKGNGVSHAGGSLSDEQTVGWIAVGPMEAFDREHGGSSDEVAERYSPDRVKVQPVYRWESRVLFCADCGRPLPTVGGRADS